MDDIIELIERELKYRQTAMIRAKDNDSKDYEWFKAQVEIIKHLLIRIKSIEIWK